MQEETITDVDGVMRCYGFDSWDGSIYLKTDASKRLNPGRPYFYITALSRLENSCRSAEARSLRLAHEILWAQPERAQALLSRDPVPGEYMRGQQA